VFEDEGVLCRMVFYCFSGDVEMVRRCVEVGYFLSFVGMVMFKNV